MQPLTEKVLLLSPPGGMFDMTVVGNLLLEASEGARKVLVHRAVRAGEILRLKPGLFLLRPELRRSSLHPFVVAAALHAPSHISLESSLSFHGMIPEAVYQVASVTAARSRSFDTPVGLFTFHRVPARQPRAGVKAVRLGTNDWAFIATVLRAIADSVYLRPPVTWETDGLGFLTESLRIEEDDLMRIPLEDFQEIQESLRSQRTRRYLEGLRRALGK